MKGAVVMTLGGYFFFTLFAGVQVITYLAIRREWTSPALVAALGVVFSVLLAMLMSIAQQNTLLQALVVGLAFGILISALTLSAAWFFHRQQTHQHARG